MTRDRKRLPGEAALPRKTLVLKKRTVRDLDLRGRGRRIKGGQSGSYIGPAGSVIT